MSQLLQVKTTTTTSLSLRSLSACFLPSMPSRPDQAGAASPTLSTSLYSPPGRAAVKNGAAANAIAMCQRGMEFPPGRRSIVQETWYGLGGRRTSLRLTDGHITPVAGWLTRGTVRRGGAQHVRENVARRVIFQDAQRA